MRTKLAIPSNVRELRAVRVFAESLLANGQVRTALDATLLSGIAAMLGDATAAAALAERSAELGNAPAGIPRQVASTGGAFLAYAATGGPVDSLTDLLERLRVGIGSAVAVDRQATAREIYLSRGLVLTLPTFQPPSVDSLGTLSDPLFAAEYAYRHGDCKRMRRLLQQIDLSRVNVMPADLTMDRLLPEALLLSECGDTARALQRIGPTLDALRWVPATQFDDAMRAGSLMRAMLLRAELTGTGSARPTGARWARAVEALSDRRKPEGALRIRRALGALR